MLDLLSVAFNGHQESNGEKQKNWQTLNEYVFDNLIWRHKNSQANRKVTHNLVSNWFQKCRHDINKILSLDQLQLHKHALHTLPPATPERVHVLWLLN